MELIIKKEIIKNKLARTCHYRNCKILYYNPSIAIEKEITPKNKMKISYASEEYFNKNSGIFVQNSSSFLNNDEEKYRFIEKTAEDKALENFNITRQTLEEIIIQLKK